MDIPDALKAIAAQYDAHDFVDGDCHTLAVALYEAHGLQGSLLACMRKTLNEDGSVYSTGYSHMIYECPQGRIWDIGGDNADIRWEESFPDIDVPDPKARQASSKLSGCVATFRRSRRVWAGKDSADAAGALVLWGLERRERCGKVVA